MAHHIDVERAQDIIKHTFTDTSFLSTALEAPEKIQDPQTKAIVYQHDGNRPLSQLGQKVLESILLDKWLTTWHDRGIAQRIVTQFTDTEALAKVARLTGLDYCVKRSERQPKLPLSNQTSKLVIAAVIGAVWLDTNRDFDATSRVVDNLGIINTTDLYDSGEGACSTDLDAMDVAIQCDGIERVPPDS